MAWPRWKILLSSLSVRLFLWLSISIIFVFVSYSYLISQATTSSLRKALQQGAERTSEMIKQATHYGMLLNKKEDVHHTIRRIARGPGVTGIRIYAKSGEIIFSSDEHEIGTRVNLKADGCVICHDMKEPLQSVPRGERVRIYRGPEGERILGLINPIYNEEACSSASCHAHPKDKTILGVLDVRLSMASADQNLAAAKRQTLFATLLMGLLIGVISAAFIYRMVRVPVRRLIKGTARVANGDLETRIKVKGGDELGELASAFNDMTDDLRQAQHEIDEWSQRLEQKVIQKAEELNRAQKQIIHMEKMASLGKLAATVAHELNNPIAGILNYAKLINRDIAETDLEQDKANEITRYLTMIQKESVRCGDIVRNLLLFTRRSGVQFAENHLNQIIDRALMLVRHHLEMSSIKLDKRLDPDADDKLICDSNQLQQALVALLVNAVEAMTEGGTLRLEASWSEREIQVVVSDTGCGIPAEILPHLFEPFFSTKENETGVGLGLSVAYGIIQSHGGEIEATSEEGKGTRFQVTLPRRPRSKQPERQDRQDELVVGR
jgi:two-component system NtrC family sensor kinase